MINLENLTATEAERLAAFPVTSAIVIKKRYFSA